MNETTPSSPDVPETRHAAAVFQAVPITAIQQSPHQARKYFDEENLWKLAESLRQEGLIQPITVRQLQPASDRRSPSGDAPRYVYELVSGERRLRAAKLLGWAEIEARVISVISEGEVAAKGLIENLQRENLNPLEEAEGFSRLHKVDPAYWTHERIGQVTGKSRAYITQSLGLLRLPEKIKEDVRHAAYSRGHALEIARLPGVSLQLSVSKMVPNRLTREQTRKLVDAILTGKKSLKLNKPGTLAHAKSAHGQTDPLADLWADFVMNPWIGTPGSYRVRYLGDWRWSFEVPGPAVESSAPAAEVKTAVRCWIADFLLKLGRSLGSH